MSTTRIYLVRENIDEKPCALIRASSAAQAARHYVMRNYDVSVPSQDDLIAAVGTGLSVEDAAPVPTEN